MPLSVSPVHHPTVKGARVNPRRWSPQGHLSQHHQRLNRRSRKTSSLPHYPLQQPPAIEQWAPSHHYQRSNLLAHLTPVTSAAKPHQHIAQGCRRTEFKRKPNSIIIVYHGFTFATAGALHLNSLGSRLREPANKGLIFPVAHPIDGVTGTQVSMNPVVVGCSAKVARMQASAFPDAVLRGKCSCRSAVSSQAGNLVECRVCCTTCNAASLPLMILVTNPIQRVT